MLLWFTLAAVLFTGNGWAFEPFTIRNIEVEGAQRISKGTLFNYLPLQIGDRFDDAKSQQALGALYKTGFFNNIEFLQEGENLIIKVEERPSIAAIALEGNHELSTDDLKTGLKSAGLAEGKIFDRSLLDKIKLDLQRQYFVRGYYAVEIETETAVLEDNRVNLNIKIREGEVATIKQINLIGNQTFGEDELLDKFELGIPPFYAIFSDSDQYSKQKLSADVETLRSHYLDRGYINFTVDSTQVSITPDKKDIYISINITEGEKYMVSGYKIAGDLPVPEKDLDSLVTLKAGSVFSREKLNESIKKMAERLGNDGFAFANVNAAPELDKEKHQVAFTYLVDPGRKVYVRRIEIAGNNKTQDQVIRREMRQQEGAAYAANKITRSRERIDRLGYFSEVNLETPAVQGATDQVDVNVSVTEKSTGNILLGAGFSSSEGIILSGSVSQNNLFGTGNKLAVQVNSGSVNTVYALSFTNPYFTADGVSLGYDIYRRDQDTSSLDGIAQYQTSTIGIGGRVGVPINELDSINFGAAVEQYTLDLTDNSPTNYKKFALDFGGDTNGVTTSSLRLDAGWSRDSRNSALYPTVGSYQRVYGEVGTPVGDLEYYKLNYQYQRYWELSSTFTLMLNGEIGYGGGLGGKPMPFFRNFFAGGNTSVRGFETGTLGPKTLDSAGTPYAVGGDTRLVGNAELFFPFPGIGKDRSLRLSVFMDAGAAFGPDDYLGRYSSFSVSDMRYSTGVGVTWYSPFGPLKFSLAAPLNAKTDDKTQAFQFQLGSVF